MQDIKLIIVDHDLQWMKRLETFLSEDQRIKVVGRATNGSSALELVKQTRPDVLVLDLTLFGRDHLMIQVVEEAREFRGVAIMTSLAKDEEEILKAYDHGAVDFVVRSDFTTIRDAVTDAYSYASPIRPGVAQQVREKLCDLNEQQIEHEREHERELERRTFINAFTPTEKDILLLFGQGYRKIAVANKLCISESTVRNHVSNILRKSGYKRMRQLISKGKEIGLFDSPPSQTMDK